MSVHMCQKDSDVFISQIVYSDSEYGLLFLILILYSYVLNVMSKKIVFRRIGPVGMLVG